jgi:hypothetical protein
LSKSSAFPGYLGADHHKKHHDQYNQQTVDYGDGTYSAAQQDFEPIHQGAHQVGKEDGEQEGNQSCAGHVEKAQPQRKQQHRDQNPRRACISQQQ